jgi:hypothetical protein
MGKTWMYMYTVTHGRTLLTQRKEEENDAVLERIPPL